MVVVVAFAPEKSSHILGEEGMMVKNEKRKEKNLAESNLSEREVDSIAVKQEEIAIAAR